MFELPSWSTVSRDFADFLVTDNKGEGTARTYVANVGAFWRWCIAHESDPRLADRPLIRHWAAERQQQASKERTYNELAALRIFYKFAVEEGWRDDDPTENVRIKREKLEPTKPFTLEEMDALQRACHDERERMIIDLMLYTGLRISEVAGLRVEDIDWQRGLISVIGKGEKQGSVAPHPDFMGRFHAYLGMFPTNPIWPTQKGARKGLTSHRIRDLIYAIGERAGVQDVRPHRFRATFGTFFMEQYGDIHALQAILRHANINTTARYAYWTQDQRAKEMSRRFAAGRHEATG